MVEYRVLEKMASAFLQGEELDAMVIILSGRCVLALSYQQQAGMLTVKTQGYSRVGLKFGGWAGSVRLTPDPTRPDPTRPARFQIPLDPT